MNVINKEVVMSGFLQAVFLAYLATVLAQNEMDTERKPDIMVISEGTCTTNYDYIQCKVEKRCKAGKKIEWEVTNNAKDAIVAVLNLKHTGSGLYVDPLVGPGNDDGLHAVEVSYGDTKLLQTKVRKIENDYLLGGYEYKVAVSFDKGVTFSVCLDPRIDIGK